MFIRYSAIRPFPADKCVITTDVAIKPALLESPDETAHSLGIDWFNVSLRGTKKHRDGLGHSCVVQLHRYDALKLFCARSAEGRWTIRTITLNPGKILSGHNGLALDENEFIHAMSIATRLLRPVLVKPGDHVHLIPGVHPAGEAYWSKLELPLNLHDPEGALWSALRNARYPLMTPRPTSKDSMMIGNAGSALSIAIYCKDKEMEKLCRQYKEEYANRILRVEVRLKGERLLSHLRARPGNVAEIRRKPRLVRFCGSDLVAAHQMIVRELQGCYPCRDAAVTRPMDEKTGRMMGIMAAVMETPLDEILRIYRERFQPSDGTFYRLRRAAMDELALFNPLSPERVFSQKAYQYQPEISIRALENADLLAELRATTEPDPLIANAYRTPPDGTLFIPPLRRGGQI
jgi:hypothetical protein